MRGWKIGVARTLGGVVGVVMCGAVLGGCQCDCGKKSGGADSAHADASGPACFSVSAMKERAASEFVMPAGGKDVLLLMARGAACTTKDGELHLTKGDMRMHVWLVPDAKTVEEGVSRIDRVITPEFTSFTPTHTTIVAIGSPGSSTHVLGTGYEADDGDPGTADAIVFMVDGRIFVACVHGEYLSPESQKWMEEVVATARGPVTGK